MSVPAKEVLEVLGAELEVAQQELLSFPKWSPERGVAQARVDALDERIKKRHGAFKEEREAATRVQAGVVGWKERRAVNALAEQRAHFRNGGMEQRLFSPFNADGTRKSKREE